MALIGILIVILGFAFKFDTILVVIVAGLATGLASGMGFGEILQILGQTFVEQRHMTIFLLTLPIIGMCERFGLKERALELISKAKGLSTGKLLTLYLFIRQFASAISLKVSGHAQFVRPLINPMAQGAAESKYGDLPVEAQDKIKGAAAAMDNYGNFFGQNLFLASSGVLLITGTLEELGYVDVSTLHIAIASIPIAVIAFLIIAFDNHRLDKKIKKICEQHRATANEEINNTENLKED
ncbi:DUF969 domain-containing protein [uncultured Clostridium sp.]|uniref:DUF969 domain-containing protein n=1 Tax=uncultured Clostridium sp. TaxID=59620 RepID=UPI002628444E|nr:DUF969 domain-containing protein [uncultured Clostridium sp.]